MAKKRKPENKTKIGEASEKPKTSANIFARTNRGILLDVFIFLINLVLIQQLAARFVMLCEQAGDGDAVAQFALFLFCLGLLVLPPLGATLKRWHFHQRLKAQGVTDGDKRIAFGCFFNPIFYFVLNVLIISVINTFITQFLYGNKQPEAPVFLALLFFGIIFIIFQTIIVYRYFLPPKDAPPSRFLREPRSEILGDACIFLNMILFQILWSLSATFIPERPPNVSVFSEVLFRLFLFVFASLLIYFPPRIFYLAEDIRRPRAWLTILLANSPIIWRLLYGAF